ncbi:hypothetical protein [Embleya sp. NPDC059237]|uniref:hypothetical protein n=1 Tax=Embleya sp. NPDC059237 TaxID=3346784 RepID=UPI0036851DAC
MGRYVINGEVVDLAEERPVAADVKRATGNPGDDWVMVTMPDGRVKRLPDREPLPTGVTDVTVVPRYEYGR